MPGCGPPGPPGPPGPGPPGEFSSIVKSEVASAEVIVPALTAASTIGVAIDDVSSLTAFCTAASTVCSPAVRSAGPDADVLPALAACTDRAGV